MVPLCVAKEPTANATANVGGSGIFLRAVMKDGGERLFLYRTDGIKYMRLGPSFRAREGKWIGAKIGIFAGKPNDSRESGYADFDYFRFE
jgi:hypothetical protein